MFCNYVDGHYVDALHWGKKTKPLPDEQILGGSEEDLPVNSVQCIFLDIACSQLLQLPLLFPSIHALLSPLQSSPTLVYRFLF